MLDVSLQFSQILENIYEIYKRQNFFEILEISGGFNVALQ